MSMSDSRLMSQLEQQTIKNRIPIRVHFDLTYRCNEDCVHCYLDHADHGELGTTEVKLILDQLKEAGTFFLMLSGGEIFLRKDIFELLNYARSHHHFDVTIKTNGTLIDIQRAKSLVSTGVRFVHVSIYSSKPEIHDAITRTPGSFLRTIKAVRIMKDQGVRVKLCCPLMPQNVADYRNIVELAMSLEIPYTFDITITPRMNGNMDLLVYRLSAQDVRPVLSDPMLNPKCQMDDEVVSRHNDERDNAIDVPCSAGHNSCYISPYGDVYPCVQFLLLCGNLRSQNFSEIWFHSKEMLRVAGIRDSLVPVCGNCEIRNTCERCPGLALMEDGDFNGPSSRACELAEVKTLLRGTESRDAK